MTLTKILLHQHRPRWAVLMFFVKLMTFPAVGQSGESDPRDPLLTALKSAPDLLAVAENPTHEVQILYTQIDRSKSNDEAPTFRSFRWKVDAAQYFYPASTVKLPASVLALEKLEAIARPELNRNTPMFTLGLEKEVPASPIARYIRKIFLVSSNSANNRLFEWVGPAELCDGLQKRGYEGVRIFHRLSVRREPGAIHCNAIQFQNSKGNVVHEQPIESFENHWPLTTDVLKGVAYLENGTRVEKPKNFANLNGFPLEAQQRVLRALVFPESLPEEQRFKLSDNSRHFLLREMSRWTSESSDPVYDPATHTDPDTKKLFFGTEAKRPGDPDIRMFSKSGSAYGTLTDNAYFADFDNGIDFFLSATILVNANGTFNDDVYEYDTIGIPFLKELGRAVHTLELTRDSRQPNDLDSVKFDYQPF